MMMRLSSLSIIHSPLFIFHHPFQPGLGGLKIQNMRRYELRVTRLILGGLQIGSPDCTMFDIRGRMTNVRPCFALFWVSKVKVFDGGIVCIWFMSS